MHIRHIRNELLSTLQTVVGVVERRQTLPILANVHLEARESELVVRATDLEIEMEVSCPVQGLKPGKVMQPLRAAIAGTSESPGMFEMLEALGQGRVVARVERMARG